MELTVEHLSAGAGTRLDVRRAGAEDLPAVIALDRTITGLGKPHYFEDLFERYGHRHEDGRFFLVAEPADGAGEVVGFVIGEVRAWEFGSPPCGWVFAISVDPEARQTGVGTRLLAAISECFIGAGVDKMRTMLSRDDHLLMSFFRSQGMMAGPYIQLEKDLAR